MASAKLRISLEFQLGQEKPFTQDFVFRRRKM